MSEDEGVREKSSEPVMSIGEVIGLIESVLPSPLVQRSWSLGPQRMCQELRRTVDRLRRRQLVEKGGK